MSSRYHTRLPYNICRCFVRVATCSAPERDLCSHGALLVLSLWACTHDANASTRLVCCCKQQQVRRQNHDHRIRARPCNDPIWGCCKDVSRRLYKSSQWKLLNHAKGTHFGVPYRSSYNCLCRQHLLTKMEWDMNYNNHTMHMCVQFCFLFG